MAETDYKILRDSIQNLIEEEAFREVEGLIGELHPADLADLIEHLEDDERLSVFRLLPPERAGEVLVELSAPLQESLTTELGDAVLAQILNELQSDDAADIFSHLSHERAENVIKLVRPEVSEELHKLVGYETDTAGGIMALEFVSVNANSTIREAIHNIRKKREEVENLYYVWVVDDSGRLAGVVSIKNLVLEPRDRLIKDIMNPDVISVDVNTDQEEVARIVKQYDLVNIPVINGHDRLIGRITHDDIIDVIEEEANEDISRMGGVLDQEISEESALKISRHGFPGFS